MFKKAERKRVKLRLAVEGPSGSGKTYTALLLAQGLAPGGKYAVIDTENDSASLYANICDFDSASLTPPYTPERYIQLIKQAQTAYDVIIIDSASHEWSGKGGCLDIHGAMPGNSFTNWAKVTPRHDAFIQAILQAKCHVICTMRSKESYVIEENSKGKQEPRKVGAEAVQRQGVNYEFSVVLTMDVTHQATSTKDRTGLFPVNHWFIPSIETGFALRTWLESGAEAKPEPKPEPAKFIPATVETLAELSNQYAGDPEDAMLDDLNETMREAAARKGASFEAIGDIRELSEPMAKWLIQRNNKLKGAA